MKRKRNISINKIRLALVTILAVQFPNMLCLLSSQISDVIGDAGEIGVQSFKDIDFTNISALDNVARKAMKTLHDDLDHDDDGNVSITEGATFIHREEFKGHSGKSNLPGFATDKDGRITELEFWEAWAKSTVHNWTVTQMMEWLSVDVELPQYAFKFKQYAIPGAAMPILASNSSIVLSLVDGIKEHRLKIWLKAMEVVLCGYTSSKSSLMKDILVSVSLILALGGIAFGIHVHRNATHTVSLMQSKMNNLQRELAKLDEEDEEGVWMKDLESTESQSSAPIRRDSDGTVSNASLVSSASGQTKLMEVLDELADVKQALEQAEERLKLNDKHWSPPTRLLTCLKTTYQVEMKLHEVKRHTAHKKVEQAKAQFQKMKKKVSIFSSVQFIHSRQVDSFDLEVQAAKDALREIQRDSHEHRKRWMELETILRCKFSSSPTRHLPVGTKLDEARKLSKTTDVSESGVSMTTSTELDRNSNVTSSSNRSSYEDLESASTYKDASSFATTGKLMHRKQQESCPALGDLSGDLKTKKQNEAVLRARRPVSLHYGPTIEHKLTNNRNRSASMVNMKTSLATKPVVNVTTIAEEASPEIPKSTLQQEGYHTLPKKRKSPMFMRKKDSVASAMTPESYKKRVESPVRTPSLGPADTKVRKAESTHSLPELNGKAEEISHTNATNGNLDTKISKSKRFGTLFKRKKKAEKT
uniref:stromal interaction molecule homolog isoform X1 n=1 Tax=Ciona intestinalis TaxID=7719 RepID=UPI000180C6A4|nr:stromal interaction molecule homolog isoform X1 [Ciona intestinalis]|eukprot:XP_002126383.1 stromal interaction molecule homolog isoform X1 [Ciona intestinalis]